jgi:O-acetyl-ADP-ribose deacetylase (regulator of RNase III)
MNIVVFDINGDFVNEAKRLEKYGLTVIKSNVENLNNVNALVSPANSFGFMNGGIDQIYMNMYPNIQNIVQNKIKQIGLQTTLGRYYLPIGSSVTVNANNNMQLIVSPTMFFPGNIKNTMNVFLDRLCL